MLTQKEFDNWKDHNQALVTAWEVKALVSIYKGEKHLRAAAITEWVRDHTPNFGEKPKSGRYKIPNDCNPWLSRWFIWKYPQHSNKFNLTKSFRYENKD